MNSTFRFYCIMFGVSAETRRTQSYSVLLVLYLSVSVLFIQRRLHSRSSEFPFVFSKWTRISFCTDLSVSHLPVSWMCFPTLPLSPPCLYSRASQTLSSIHITVWTWFVSLTQTVRNNTTLVSFIPLFFSSLTCISLNICRFLSFLPSFFFTPTIRDDDVVHQDFLKRNKSHHHTSFVTFSSALVHLQIWRIVKRNPKTPVQLKKTLIKKIIKKIQYHIS